MDLITAGLVGQLVAVLALAVLVMLGPPEPRQAIRVREDGQTERVEHDRGRELWHLLARFLVAMFACSTVLGVAGIARA